jgi:hypothetical protein
VGYFNFQEGAAGGSGVDYPLRLMVLDEQERLRAEREQQGITGREEEFLTRGEDAGAAGREKERAQGRERDNPRAEPPPTGPAAAEIPTPYLLSDDSPLILRNIPDYVLDPESAIKEIKARVYGMGGGSKDGSARLFDGRGKALYPPAPPTHIDAETLMLRLKAFVAQDSRTILATARQHGTRGEPREFYSLLTSPDRPLSNREIRQPLLRLCEERFPLSPFIAYIHRDTHDAHAHGWLSALRTDGLKLRLGREKVDGEWVDRFKQLDEDYLRFYCEMVGDWSVLEEHLAKKAEWYEKKALVKAALTKGERPPALPFRERHRYDELGERRQRKERRELEAKGEDPGPKKPVAPVARCRSTWECAELWGKTVHAEARLRDARFRREELDKLPRYVEVEVDGRRSSLHQVHVERRLLERRREGKEDTRRAAERERREAELLTLEAKISEEVETRRQLLSREFEELELNHKQHLAAWEKTVANRDREGLPEIKYPLHNARQLEEMRDIAERTRDAELLRHAHDYELLDRPAGRDEQKREFADRWAREVMAEVTVHEHEHGLRIALREEPDVRPSEPDQQARAATAGREAGAGRYVRLIEEWTSGGWSSQDIQRSLLCVTDEQLRPHAEAYLRAHEYHGATRDVLRDYRSGVEVTATPPALNPAEVGRIRALLSEEGAVRDERARVHLQGVVHFVSSNGRTSDRDRDNGDAGRLLERSLYGDGTTARAEARAVPATERSAVTRPFDDRWFAKLPSAVVLAETRALAVGMRQPSREQHDAARREAAERREALEFARWVRDAAGVTEPTPARASHAEEKELENLRRFVLQQLFRDRDWTQEQVGLIREFAHRAPEKDREKLADALDRTEQRLELARVEREERLFAEKVARLNEAIARADDRYPMDVFGRLDLDQLREPERVREETEKLARQYLDAAKEQGLRPEQFQFRAGSAEDHARMTVNGAAERAERLRAALVIAAADSPSLELLKDRLRTAGIETEVTGGTGRAATSVKLKLGGLNLDTRTLDHRIDIGKILSNRDEKPLEEKESAVKRCVQFALLSQREQNNRLSQLVSQGGRVTYQRAIEIYMTQYALHAVAAVRSGAAPDWHQIDRQIAGMPAPKDLTRDNNWLAKTWGVGRLLEQEKNGHRAAPTSIIRPLIPDRSPTRPSHDPGRDGAGRTRGGGSGRGGRGGR